MSSIWSQSAQISERATLNGDLKTEAAVIGGGMAGVLIAHYLQQRGIKTVLLEADRLGSGQTKNTTAKITIQHGLIYAKLIRDMGEERAGEYARANREAAEEYRRLIRAMSIHCQLEERPAYLYSATEEQALREEVEAARALGIDAKFTTDTTLPFPVKGAARFEHQAQFHPLLFLNAVAQGLTVYEHTIVTAVEGNTLHTDRGDVTAEHIIFATHFPFVNAPGYYFLRMHQERSYVLALSGAQALEGMYLGVGGDGLSLRNSGDLLLLGGGSHRTGENSTGGKYELLRGMAERYWPHAQEMAHWSAQDCIPLDGVPYIGQFSAATPNWYVATGFQKWGMTSAMVAARLITDLVTGRETAHSGVFSPQRFRVSASAKNLLVEAGQAVKGLSRTVLEPPRAALDALPPGHGGIVEAEGEKVGVYKNRAGEIFTVALRCPHLGCQVEWNPDEKSWDCPCHGSRFDYRGNLIDNPAQENL